MTCRTHCDHRFGPRPPVAAGTRFGPRVPARMLVRRHMPAGTPVLAAPLEGAGATTGRRRASRGGPYA